MKRETGDPNFPIWLSGDSEPKNWQSILDVPLDPRHPARHNIWTSVLDIMQDRFFRERHVRMETKALFIRNAIGDPQLKPPAKALQWPTSAETEVQYVQRLLIQYRPRLLLSFGAFAFEFGRRALDEGGLWPYGYWGMRWPM